MCAGWRSKTARSKVGLKDGRHGAGVKACCAFFPSRRPRVGGKQVKDASGLSLKHLLIGSEGTLAVITKCLLRLLPKPETTVSVLVPFADLGTGIRSVLTILQANANPTAVEFMERKVVALGESFSGVQYPRPDAGSYILLTFDGHESEVNANIERVRRLALDNGAID